jgi:hypothetical protein
MKTLRHSPPGSIVARGVEAEQHEMVLTVSFEPAQANSKPLTNLAMR